MEKDPDKPLTFEMIAGARERVGKGSPAGRELAASALESGLNLEADLARLKSDRPE